jgi:hypothetical protein
MPYERYGEMTVGSLPRSMCSKLRGIIRQAIECRVRVPLKKSHAIYVPLPVIDSGSYKLTAVLLTAVMVVLLTPET